MTELNSIYGCFPDIRCMASLMMPSHEVDFALITFVLGMFVGVVLGVGIMAVMVEGGR